MARLRTPMLWLGATVDPDRPRARCPYDPGLDERASAPDAAAERTGHEPS
jgi:hypothetical protein